LAVSLVERASKSNEEVESQLYLTQNLTPVVLYQLSEKVLCVSHPRWWPFAHDVINPNDEETI